MSTTNNPKPRKPFEPAWLLAILVPAIFIIAIIVYLNSKDGYGIYHQLTGWQALKQEGGSFWTWVYIGTPLGLVFGYLVYANASGSGSVGRKLNGNGFYTYLFLILALICLCGPWAKGCTDKTNSGVTSAGFKADSTGNK